MLKIKLLNKIVEMISHKKIMFSIEDVIFMVIVTSWRGDTDMEINKIRRKLWNP